MKNKLLKKIMISTGVISSSIALATPIMISQMRKISNERVTRSELSTKNSMRNGYFEKIYEKNFMTLMPDPPMMIDEAGNIWIAEYQKVVKSTDDGATFTQVIINSPTEFAVTFIFEDRVGNIWIGTTVGIWKSTDDGITFAKVQSVGLPTKEIFFSLLVDQDGNIWIGEEVLWKSTDDGATFTQVQGDLPIDDIFVTLMEDKIGNIWVETNHGNLWKSADEGTKFYQVANGLPLEFNSIFFSIDKTSGNIWVGILLNGLWKSTDDGATFIQVQGVESTWVTSLLEDENGNIWVGTHDGELWKSTNSSSVFNLITHFNGKVYINESPNNNLFVWEVAGFATGTARWWKYTPTVIFTPGATHNTIEEEGQTIYISDQSITVNIPPADQIIIDGEIISKTKEVTQYTFDGTESPHTITITIAGQNYIILVYIVESSVIENGLNYSYYNPTTDELSIYMNQTIVEGIKLTYGGRPQGVDFLSFVEASNKWNDFKSNEGLKNNLVNNLGMDWEMGFDLISSIDSQLTQSTGFISKDYTTAFINKINAMNPTDGISLKIEVDIDNGPAINNLGSPEINTDDMTTKYWDDILFNQIYKNGGS